jgi:hypothetical protein
MANENFYAEVRFQGKSAVLLLTSEGSWQLRLEDPGFDFEKHAGKKGTHKVAYSDLRHFFAPGDPDERFFMTDIRFPPSIVLEPQWLENKFGVGEKWAKALGYANTQKAAWNTQGHWYAIATGPLMTWVKQYCDERSAELKQLAFSLGLNLAAIADPTGALSLAGAVEASTRGDYLGCALNLVAAIPLLGKAAQAVKNAQIVSRIAVLNKEITILTQWLKQSKAILGRTPGLVAKGLEGVVGAAKKVKAVKGAPAGGSGGKILNTLGKITKLDPKDWTSLGLLPKEVEALSALAKKGYYFVVRACNPERVAWLEWGAKVGCRTLSKPLWMKSKSLKGGDWAGLIGWRKLQKHASMWPKLVAKADPPPGFNPQFLTMHGGKMKALYKMKPNSIKETFEITDDAKGAAHFLVETEDGYLILVDAKGAAYVSDFDVVLVQKALPSGKSYGPPGMNIGPKGTPYKGGDNADLRPFWNQQFGKVGYPPGYEVIQHGEATGTFGNFASVSAKFDPALEVKNTIWEPGDSWISEKLIVAADAEGLSEGVGVAANWKRFKEFHEGNPVGDFRITPKLSPKAAQAERTL